ncbi:hypothetical protein GWI33_013187 [Rhynchophorus ferrugineus]|uniref:Uncharacterized protein n=1 Tax=Rhynchophorus ferrugineus TaxID=354439 RepID=A0A834I546_RHYFE|nr:hypothetical protein GWI33_013187 [Rhynchophorus ferrugineus]
MPIDPNGCKAVPYGEVNGRPEVILFKNYLWWTLAITRPSPPGLPAPPHLHVATDPKCCAGASDFPSSVWPTTSTTSKAGTLFSRQSPPPDTLVPDERSHPKRSMKKSRALYPAPMSTWVIIYCVLRIWLGEELARRHNILNSLLWLLVSNHLASSQIKKNMDRSNDRTRKLEYC